MTEIYQFIHPTNDIELVGHQRTTLYILSDEGKDKITYLKEFQNELLSIEMGKTMRRWYEFDH